MCLSHDFVLIAHKPFQLRTVYEYVCKISIYVPVLLSVFKHLHFSESSKVISRNKSQSKCKYVRHITVKRSTV
jgi:hypothetical protein